MSRGNAHDANIPCNLLHLGQLPNLVRLLAHTEPRRRPLRLAAVMANDDLKGVHNTWLRTEPILDRQAGQMHKILDVVRHEGQVVNESRGGNEQVHIRCGLSRIEECRPQGAEGAPDVRGHVEHRQIVEQVKQRWQSLG
jgi:hypothetical protein